MNPELHKLQPDLSPEWESAVRDLEMLNRLQSNREVPDPIRNLAPEKINPEQYELGIQLILDNWRALQQHSLASSEQVADITELHARLKKEPFVFSSASEHFDRSRDDRGDVEIVPLHLVVGSVSPQMNTAERPGWQNTYEARTEQVEAMIAGIHDRPEETLARMFCLDDLKEEGGPVMSYVKIMGPSGPIYMTLDGSHRTAILKANGIPQAIARVYEADSYVAFKIHNQDEIVRIKELIQSGLGEGIHLHEQGDAVLVEIDDYTKLPTPWVLGDYMGMHLRYRELYPNCREDMIKNHSEIPENWIPAFFPSNK